MEHQWLYNIPEDELVLLTRGLYLDEDNVSIEDILNTYTIHETPGFNGIGYKIFISSQYGIVFKFIEKILNYSPALVVEDYEQIVMPPPGSTTIVFKKDKKLYIVGKYVAIL